MFGWKGYFLSVRLFKNEMPPLWVSASFWIFSEWASFTVMQAYDTFFANMINGNQDWCVWMGRDRKMWGFVHAETHWQVHTQTHTYCTQRSGVFTCNTSESLQCTWQTFVCHRISSSFWYWSAVCTNARPPQKITHWLNIQIVRCTWEWFTKLAKSLRKFSDVLILSKYHLRKGMQWRSNTARRAFSILIIRSQNRAIFNEKRLIFFSCRAVSLTF